MTSADLSVAEALAQVVAAHTDAGAADWLRETRAGLGAPAQTMAVRLALARAGRKLGDAVVSLSAQQRASLPAGPTYEHWQCRDFGRASVVLTACATLSAADDLALIEALIRRGDAGEQVSLLRMATLLPESQRLVDVMVDACRTNALDVFAAIACENPFVRDHFPEANFNQVVLKALFLDVDVNRIVGLPTRVNPELVRMVRDYGDERRAAGRSIPTDIERIERLAEAKTP